MKITLVLLACVAAALTSCASAPLEQSQVALQLGVRQLDDDTFWEPVDEQGLLGVDFTLMDGNGVGGEFGFAVSADDTNVSGTELDVTTAELYGGFHKAWLNSGGGVQPYLGGGLSLVNTEVEARRGFFSGSEDDNSVGLYGRAGFDFFFTEAFFLGVDVRYLFGTDIDLPGFVSTDVDGLLLAGRIGAAF